MSINQKLLAIAGIVSLATLAFNKRFWCGMLGHDGMLEFEANRMYLFCPTCGYKSPGWDGIGTIKPEEPNAPN